MEERIINYDRILDYTLAEGPGRRLCIWTQGCLKSCPGCCNEALQALKVSKIITVSQFCKRIDWAKNEYNLEGVTFLGGEPFLQASALSEAARFSRLRGLSVMTFTGYTLEELHSSAFPGSAELISNTDVLVDGPYWRNQPDLYRNWVGSENQKFHYLSDFYDNKIETAEEYRGIVEMDFPQEVNRNVYSTAINGCPKTMEILEKI